MQYKKLTFIGAGNMVKAIIAGLIESGYPAKLITATAPSQTHRLPLEHTFGIRTNSDNLAEAEKAEVVILGVKPQLMAKVCEPLQSLDWSNKLVISIAAGIRCERLKQMLAAPLNLVRVMPNTPAQIGQGMAGLFAPSHVDEQQKALAEQLIQAVGKTHWLSTEQEMNLFTAIAGSSPAYLFLLMEAMQNEASHQGYNKQHSREIIAQAMLGAAHMVMANPDIPLNALYKQLTSKEGVTAAALDAFAQYQFSDIVAKVIQAAVKRADEMDSLF